MENIFITLAQYFEAQLSKLVEKSEQDFDRDVKAWSGDQSLEQLKASLNTSLTQSVRKFREDAEKLVVEGSNWATKVKETVKSQQKSFTERLLQLTIKNQLFPESRVLSDNFAATFKENYSKLVNELIEKQDEFLTANYGIDQA